MQKSFWKSLPGITAIVFVFVGLLVAVGYFIASFEPAFMAVRREAVQQSPEYIETKVGLLNDLHRNWKELDGEIAELSANPTDENVKIVRAKKSQQKTIVTQMQDEVKKIPSAKVPQAVKDFLSENQ